MAFCSLICASTSLPKLLAKIRKEITFEGKNPFSLDSKAPQWDKFHDFLLGEVRYLSVKKAYPNEAEELFADAQRMAKLRYQSYVRQNKMDWAAEEEA